MAWTDPANFVVASFPTAAQLNAILDNFDALKSGARAYHNAAQSIAHNTTTALAFNSERYDVDGVGGSTIHDNVTNNSRLTCRVAGVYSIVGCVQWAGSTTGLRQVEIRLNGATIIGQVIQAAVIATEVTLNVTCEYALAVNDYVELLAYQNSGIALNVNVSGNASPEFSMHFQGG